MQRTERSPVGDAVAACLAAVATIALLAALSPAAARAGEKEDAQAAKLARGAYLVTISGCHHCHTPLKMGPRGPERDMSRMLSGHPESVPLPDPPGPAGPWNTHVAAPSTAFAGPFGVSIAPNLTPDPETGLQNWSEERFFRAMRNGQHNGGGRPILPPMPWSDIGKMTDGDLSALWAYLRSIPPVKNLVPDSRPAPPPPAK